MCINASNFFTRSRPIWETRGSLALPALRALPRISGSDPGGSEVRTPLRGGQICGRAAPPAPAPTASTAGIGIGLAMDTELRGNLQPSLAFIYVFILRSLGSTWCFSSLGDNLLPPNDAPDLS